ncbi:MAG: hypothetical protein JWM98_3106 [Thermoleophilia bacterium]|nr:hypothetical protein [Thermoleophilia bacterium]
MSDEHEHEHEQHEDEVARDDAASYPEPVKPLTTIETTAVPPAVADRNDGRFSGAARAVGALGLLLAGVGVLLLGIGEVTHDGDGRGDGDRRTQASNERSGDGAERGPRPGGPSFDGRADDGGHRGGR